MVGEKFETYLSQVPKNAFKFSIMFGENVEIQRFETAFKLSIMVAENFKNFIAIA